MMQEEVDALTRQQVLQLWRIEQREPHCCPSVSEHLVESVKGCTEPVGVTLIGLETLRVTLVSCVNNLTGNVLTILYGCSWWPFANH